MEMKGNGTLSLKVPWGYIKAKTWGNSENKNRVLLVHGILDNAGSFDRLIALLPQNFYYVCVDLPGHGLSSSFPPGQTFCYNNYILALRYALDELQWEYATYIGHSFGAHIGLIFSMVYPDRIRKLVIIDGVIPIPPSNKNLVHVLRKTQDTIINEYKVKNSSYYTRDEVMYALMNLRKCYLNSQAAEAIFERAVSKVADNLYTYNRDIRATKVLCQYSMDQSLFILKCIKMNVLYISASDTLPAIQKLKGEITRIVRNKNNITLVNVKGNHDVHNNYPERISGHIEKFLNYIPSKL